MVQSFSSMVVHAKRQKSRRGENKVGAARGDRAKRRSVLLSTLATQSRRMVAPAGVWWASMGGYNRSPRPEMEDE
ncbi:MAG TPA: hypothetical protein DCP11_00170 [Microbacteriaceae bacterium]|nr:hypothetical protein [Microbacteriaceae bacterium]